MSFVTNFIVDLDHPIAQKIQKIHKSKTGKTIISKKQIGYIIAGIVDNTIVVGYSLCNRKDRYDYINGKRTSGFGKHMAYERAVKWSSQDSIEVPASIMPLMTKFIKRCESYYKDKECPNIVQQSMDPKKGAYV